MSDKIIPFPGMSLADLNCDDILEANKGEFDVFVMVGYTPDGAERFISTTSDAALMMWLLARAQKTVLESGDPLEDEEYQ